LRIVVEGDDAKRFHERLTGFVAMAKDWDALSFEQRVALCDKYGVCYLATEVE
jgi:hypothetical protein